MTTTGQAQNNRNIRFLQCKTVTVSVQTGVGLSLLGAVASLALRAVGSAVFGGAKEKRTTKKSRRVASEDIEHQKILPVADEQKW